MQSNSKLSLTKKCLLKIIISIILFTIIYFLLFLTSYHLVSLKTWDVSNILYKFLYNIRELMFYFWLIGIIIICVYFLSKFFYYISSIEKETYKMKVENNEMIVLPSELYQIQNSVNFVKQQAIRNEEVALEVENSKKEMITFLAHDLKTPLTIIIGYLDLIVFNNKIDTKEKEEYLNIVLKKAADLEFLVNEMFEVSCLNEQDLVCSFQKIDLQLLLEQIIDDFYPVLLNEGKEIKFNKISKIIFINGDSQKLFRLFNNLIKNAITYSLANSTINIDVKIKNNYVTIIIKNLCSPLSDMDVDKIFDKFYRCDSSRNSQRGGNGLGLAITKELVKLHNGKINVNYKNGNICFTVTLPILKS